jgi:hypothetical protein
VPQVNGAGPPWTSTSAVVGGLSSRNCSACDSVAVTDRVLGEMVPTRSPTATSWSTSTSRLLSVPAPGALTVAVRTRGAGRLTVGLPSASVPVTGSRSSSQRISSSG